MRTTHRLAAPLAVLLGAALTAAAPPSSASIVESPGAGGESVLVLERSIDVSSADRLIVDVPELDVEVNTAETPADGSPPRARVRVTCVDPPIPVEAVAERLRSKGWRVALDGDRLHVGLPPADDAKLPPLVVEVTIPRSFDVGVSSAGDVFVAELHGRLRVRTTGGDVQLGRISGAAVEVHTAGGRVRATRLEADAVTIEAVEDGDADVGGDVEIAATTAPLTINTGGDGRIVTRLAREGPVELNSGRGDVIFVLERGVGAEIDVRGRKVVLGKALPLEVVLQRTAATGTVGEGGPELRVRSREGCVLIGAPDDFSLWLSRGILDDGC